MTELLTAGVRSDDDCPSGVSEEFRDAFNSEVFGSKKARDSQQFVENCVGKAPDVLECCQTARTRFIFRACDVIKIKATCASCRGTRKPVETMTGHRLR